MAAQHRTVEFKLMPTIAQSQILDSWRDAQRWVWNEGLGLLMEYESMQRTELYIKALSDPTAKGMKSYRRNMGIESDAEFDVEGIEFRSLRLNRKGYGASSQIATGRGDDYRPCCAMQIEQRLRSSNFIGLSAYMTRQRYPDTRALEGVPMVWVKGTLKSLAESWKAFKDGKRAMAQLPKFKSKKRGDRVRSLYCPQPETVRIDGDRIYLPGSTTLGGLKVVNHQLAKRWPGGKCTARIVFKASGLYLQLIGEIPTPKPKPSDRACGLDVGLEFLYSDDAGKQVKPLKHYRAKEKRLARLQRQLSRQTPGGSNHAKTQQAIALLHEEIAARRKAYNHKLSTYTVRTYGAIAVEDIKIANLMRRAKPKPREDGKGYERNGAAAKSGLSKSFADAALGQLLTMMESKSKAADREFVRVPPHYTSQECPECGSLHKKALSQRTHRCMICGHTEPRDTAAARVIRERADFSGSYRTLIRDVKPVDLAKVQGMKQESAQAESGGVVTPDHQTLNSIAPTSSQEPRKPNSHAPIHRPLSDSANPPPSEVRANPETLSLFEVADFVDNGTAPASSPKPAKAKRPAQSEPPSHAQLSLWG